jgi:hypothetical protein
LSASNDGKHTTGGGGEPWWGHRYTPGFAHGDLSSWDSESGGGKGVRRGGKRKLLLDLWWQMRWKEGDGSKVVCYATRGQDFWQGIAISARVQHDVCMYM